MKQEKLFPLNDQGWRDADDLFMGLPPKLHVDIFVDQTRMSYVVAWDDGMGEIEWNV